MTRWETYRRGTLRVLWCRITLRHKGQVDYILESGAFWMCDNCGDVAR